MSSTISSRLHRPAQRLPLPLASPDEGVTRPPLDMVSLASRDLPPARPFRASTTPVVPPAVSAPPLPGSGALSRPLGPLDSPSHPSVMAPSLRRIVCESLLEIGAGSQHAVQANVGFLRPCATSLDPLVRKLALDVLERWDPGLPPVEAAQAKWGEVEGPARMLLHAVETMDCEDHPVPAGCLRDAETAVAALDEAVGGQAPPESALKAICWLLCAVQVRLGRPQGGDPLALGLTPQELESLLHRTSNVLDSWWRHGQVEARVGPRPLLPTTSGPTPGGLAATARAHVCGSNLEFGNPFLASVSPQARREAGEVLARLGPFDVGESAELKKLDALDAGTATEVLAVLVESLDPSHPHPVENLYRFNRILAHALEAPPLSLALRPLVSLLAAYSQEAGRRGMLDPDSSVGRQQVRLYRQLMAKYPEMVTVDLVRSQLLPMLHDVRHSADEPCGMFEELWTRRPDLVRPTLDGLMDASHSMRFLDGRTALLERAFVALETPATRADLEWLAAQIHSPYRPDGLRADGLSSYSALPDLLEQLQDRHPDLARGLQLPDVHGRMAPLGRALVERVVFAPEGTLSSTQPPDDPWLRSYGPISFPNMEPVYRLAFPDPDLVEDLLQLVLEGAKDSTGLSDLSTAEQRAAAVLVSIEIAPSQRTRLRNALQVESFLAGTRAPLDPRSRAILHAFGPEVAADCCARLEQGEGSASERGDLLSLALHIADTPARVASGLDDDALRKRALRAFDPRLENAARSDGTYRICRKFLEHGGSGGDLGATWARYLEILERLGAGADLDEAHALFTWIEAQVAQGVDRERALHHALDCRLTGRDPSQVPVPPLSGGGPHIEQGADEVDIGGVKVPVRHFAEAPPTRRGQFESSDRGSASPRR